ncbi:peptidylprolyl isomerase (plasmid) [Pseudoalteromonas espejiana]
MINEPVLSNVKGTIAMAKLANDENSATSQWFFNMVDNSTTLDIQNGGFTVFGQITAQKQSNVDNISAGTAAIFGSRYHK